MSELRDYALSLIDDDDILCIEVEAVLDKADERIAELEETNRQLCFNLDEAQQVVEARDDQAAIDKDFIRQYQEQVEALQKELKAAEALQFKSYCAGYESGHHDTVETNYTPPVDYPEEWPEILADLVEAQPQESDL